MTQRDQYGDRPALVVGDDSPLEGKVPLGYAMADLAVDPYAPAGGASAFPWLTPAVMASGGGFAPGAIPPWWGGGSGTSGSHDGRSEPPVGGGSSEPPVQGGGSSEPPSGGGTATNPPSGPDLPPLQPVPGPQAGALLLSAILVLSLMRAAQRLWA